MTGFVWTCVPSPADPSGVHVDRISKTPALENHDFHYIYIITAIIGVFARITAGGLRGTSAGRSRRSARRRTDRPRRWILSSPASIQRRTVFVLTSSRSATAATDSRRGTGSPRSPPGGGWLLWGTGSAMPRLVQREAAAGHGRCGSAWLYPGPTSWGSAIGSWSIQRSISCSRQATAPVEPEPILRGRGNFPLAIKR